VAKHIEFKDRYQNMGAQLVRGVASKTNDVAGDGTTTATVLARAIFAEGCKSVAAGMNPMDVKRGVDKAVAVAIQDLQKQAKKVTEHEEIEQVSCLTLGQISKKPKKGRHNLGQLRQRNWEIDRYCYGESRQSRSYNCNGGSLIVSCLATANGLYPLFRTGKLLKTRSRS